MLSSGFPRFFRVHRHNLVFSEGFTLCPWTLKPGQENLMGHLISASYPWTKVTMVTERPAACWDVLIRGSGPLSLWALKALLPSYSWKPSELRVNPCFRVAALRLDDDELLDTLAGPSCSATASQRSSCWPVPRTRSRCWTSCPACTAAWIQTPGATRPPC